MVIQMLAYIRGILEEIEDEAVIVDHQGMGYRIYTSGTDMEAMPPIGEAVTFYLHMNIREDDISLYGFTSKEALRLFRQLIAISGIGPKAGLAILSAMSVREAQMAIMSGDVKTLTKANGIGTKVAQRVIMELKDKMDWDLLPPADGHDEMIESEEYADHATAAAMALVSLGYSRMEAMQAIKKVEHADQLTEEGLLKAALKKML